MGKYGEGLPLALHQPCSPGFLSRQPTVKWASIPALCLCQNIAEHEDLGVSCLLSHLGAHWTLSSSQSPLPHFPLFSPLALPRGPAPSWVTSQLVLTVLCYALGTVSLADLDQPWRGRRSGLPPLSTLTKGPVGFFWLMIDFTFVFLRNTF